ncbi:MAG: hypothetical protein H7070_09875 [Saprospiraceae bacterium]|nr:hypothetical protein [Pyrinomonadaceae bacterium]
MQNKVITAAFCIVSFAVFVSGQNTSVYSSLEAAKCKTLESNPEEGGSYTGECKGVGRYKLEIIEGDLRQTVNVVDPNGEKFELNLWDHFGGFSSVGQKAEWRIKGKIPVALIFRFNVSENSANPEGQLKTTSYLMVAKLGKEKPCVTDIVKPGKGQNAKARKLADEPSHLCKSIGRTLIATP